MVYREEYLVGADKFFKRYKIESEKWKQSSIMACNHIPGPITYSPIFTPLLPADTKVPALIHINH